LAPGRDYDRFPWQHRNRSNSANRTTGTSIGAFVIDVASRATVVTRHSWIGYQGHLGGHAGRLDNRNAHAQSHQGPEEDCKDLSYRAAFHHSVTYLYRNDEVYTGMMKCKSDHDAATAGHIGMLLADETVLLLIILRPLRLIKNGSLIAAVGSRVLGLWSSRVTVLSEVGRIGSLQYGVRG
jgi:hypothetical protein